MIALWIFLLTCLSISSIDCAPAFGIRYLLFNELKKTPCIIVPTSADQTISGNEIFTGAIPTPAFSSVQEIMVTMWFLPEGTDKIDYTLLSLHSLTAPPVEIFSLDYKFDAAASTNTLTGYLKGTQSNQYVGLLRTWAFLKVVIKLDPVPSGTDVVQFWISQVGASDWTPTPADSIPSPSGSISVFDMANLQINFGYPSTSLSKKPSCSKLRYAAVWLAVDPLDYSDTDRFSSTKDVSTEMLIHYDSFETMQQSPLQLVSNYRYHDRVPSPPISNNGGTIEVEATKELKLTSLLSTESRGFVLYFEFRAKRFSDSNFILMRLKFSPSYVIKVYYKTGFLVIPIPNQLFVSDGSSNTYLCTLIENTWNQMYITVSNYFGQLNARFAIKDILTNGEPDKSFNSFPAGVGPDAQIIFGDSTQSKTIAIDNIMVYKGLMHSNPSPTECFRQMEGTKVSSCMLCKNNYDLDHSLKQQCVSNPSFPTSTVKTGIADWASHTPCGNNKTYSVDDLACHCSVYKQDVQGYCSDCPSYCQGCPNNNCKKDANRDFSGFCSQSPILRFDDGYSCVPRSFSIPLRANFFYRFLEAWAEQSVSLTSEILLQSTSDSFFFTIQLKAFTETGSTFPESIVTINENTSTEVFVITLDKDAITSNYSICYIYLGAVIKCFTINAKTATWIGLWLSMDTAILTVMTSGRYESVTYPLVPALTLSNPSLCAGFCTSTSGISRLKQDISFCPFKFYKGMTNPTDLMQEMYNLMTDKTEIIAHFLFHFGGPMPYSYTNILEETSSVKNIILTEQASTIDLLRGFKSESGTSSTISDILTTQELSITLNVIVVTITELTKLFEYTIDSKMIVYSLNPIFDPNIAFFRVSFAEEGVESKKCYVKIGDPTFIAFIPRYSYLFDQSGMFFFEIEIVSETCRETLTFENKIPAQSEKYKRNIKIPDSGDVREIYINNIRLYDGNDFYFDYTLSDFCFMYYNTIDMVCVKSKSSSPIFNGVIIDPILCPYQLSKGILIYNRFTKECQDSFIIYPRCWVINEIDNVSCIQCRDSFADPTKTCNCISGYFLSPITDQCEICGPRCLECSGKADHCDLCKFDNTIVPTCECRQSNQYLTATFSCEDCSPQCGSCETSPSNCLSCSEDRINEPRCMCDLRYFSLTQSTNEICVPITCSYKCSTCEYTPTDCTACASNRVYPPDCDCEADYKEEGLTCSKCPPHQYYDQIQRDCFSCDPECIECTETPGKCKECHPELILFDDRCVCSDLSGFFVTDTGDISCTNFMDLTVESRVIDSKNCIVFTFEEPIDATDFESTSNIEKLIFFYFSQIEQVDYSIVSTTLNENELIIQLNFHKTISVGEGQATFLDNTFFISRASSKVLNPKYMWEYITFKIGPLILADDVYSSNETLQSAVDFLRDSGFALDLIRQLQLLFYVVNTLQPTSLFILVGVTVPPNLYQFQQIFGLLVFPHVNDYGVKNNPKQFDFFGKTLQDHSDVSENSSSVFENIGLSGSMFTTMPITFIQLAFWPSLALILVSLRINFVVSREGFVEKLDTILAFTIARVNSTFESSLLILVSFSINQFENLDGTQLLNRISVYFAVILNAALIFQYYRNYSILNKVYLEKQMKKIDSEEGEGEKDTTARLREIPWELFNERKELGKQINTSNSQQSSNNHPENMRILSPQLRKAQVGNTKVEAAELNVLEKLDEKSPIAIPYLYFQILKKVLLASIVVLMQEVPIEVCIISTIIMGSSLLFTAYYRPYKRFISNAVKIIGEATQLFVWICYLVVFLPYNELLDNVGAINEEETSKFITTGMACMIALLVFNAVYLIEFFFGIGILIQTFVSQKMKKKTQKNENQAPQI